MPYKPAEIEKMLKNKLKMDSSDNDHRWFTLVIEGLPPIRTKLSHNKDDVRDKIEGKICRQLHVRKNFFSELMKCTKSREEYLEQIQKDPHPPLDQVIIS